MERAAGDRFRPGDAVGNDIPLFLSSRPERPFFRPRSGGINAQRFGRASTRRRWSEILAQADSPGVLFRSRGISAMLGVTIVRWALPPALPQPRIAWIPQYSVRSDIGGDCVRRETGE